MHCHDYIPLPPPTGPPLPLDAPQLARELPGTLVFFDKFCPDLHQPSTTVAATTDNHGIADLNTHEGDGGIHNDVKRLIMPVLAACRWCSAELGRSVLSVSVVSNDNIVFAPKSCEALPKEGQGDERDAMRLLDLGGFLEKFVGGEAAVELRRRGDLLRRTHVANKVWRFCFLFCLFVLVPLQQFFPELRWSLMCVVFNVLLLYCDRILFSFLHTGVPTCCISFSPWSS